MTYGGKGMGHTSFSDQVRAVRKALHLSQEDLAHALGVSFATVNRWENEKTKPSRLARMRFASFCEGNKELGAFHV